MVAIVVATRGVMIWHQESGPRWREPFNRVVPAGVVADSTRVALLAGGYLLLAAANYREAATIDRVAG